MDILVIGGTGVMGAPLVEILSEDTSNNVYVISRHKKSSKKNNLHYIVADAFDIDSMRRILLDKSHGKFDSVVDFMVYKVDSYKEFLDMYLANSKQYIVLSTACVYQEPTPGDKITEETPRLIDLYSEEKRNDNHSYHIMKSNLDNIVFASHNKNYTMVRPHITFNTDKHLMVLWHKEMWLYRALHDKEIVLPKDALDCVQTVTYGGEAAYAISKLVGNSQAMGEVINIASDITITWREYIDMVADILPRVCGKELKIKWVETAKEISDAVSAADDFNMKDHLVRREFDIRKLRNIGGEDIVFTPIKSNLEKCLKDFIASGKSVQANAIINGYMDRVTHSKSSFKDVPGKKGKLLYLMYRYNIIVPQFVRWIYYW